MRSKSYKDIFKRFLLFNFLIFILYSCTKDESDGGFPSSPIYYVALDKYGIDECLFQMHLGTSVSEGSLLFTLYPDTSALTFQPELGCSTYDSINNKFVFLREKWFDMNNNLFDRIYTIDIKSKLFNYEFDTPAGERIDNIHYDPFTKKIYCLHYLLVSNGIQTSAWFSTLNYQNHEIENIIPFVNYTGWGISAMADSGRYILTYQITNDVNNSNYNLILVANILKHTTESFQLNGYINIIDLFYDNKLKKLFGEIERESDGTNVFAEININNKKVTELFNMSDNIDNSEITYDQNNNYIIDYTMKLVVRDFLTGKTLINNTWLDDGAGSFSFYLRN